MTGHAADSFIDVHAVVEKDKSWQIVDALPRDGHARAVTFAHLSEHFTAHPDLFMAVHARLGRRDAREGRGFNGGMAISAVDAQLRDMVLMAKGHRLHVGGFGCRNV